MSKSDYLYIVTDIYSHAVLGAYASEDDAWQAVNNTPAYCLVHKVAAQLVVQEDA